tara:strand:- start:105 stop:323 length:219 start_codon:yes stop_codon:yes gene_type:complete
MSNRLSKCAIESEEFAETLRKQADVMLGIAGGMLAEAKRIDKHTQSLWGEVNVQMMNEAVIEELQTGTHEGI